MNNGLLGCSPGHPLVRSLLTKVGTPWPAWGGEDVDFMQRVAFAIMSNDPKSALHAAAAPNSSGEAGNDFAPFLASTGPGFFLLRR